MDEFIKRHLTMTAKVPGKDREFMTLLRAAMTLIQEHKFEDGSWSTRSRAEPGELAVLRGAPRSADVEAASDDVRVLVIGGTQLRHLVADRPQVAQAMLTSLAERLATLIEEGPTGTGITATAALRS